MDVFFLMCFFGISEFLWKYVFFLCVFVLLGDSLSFLPWDLSPLNIWGNIFFFQPPVHSRKSKPMRNIWTILFT